MIDAEKTKSSTLKAYNFIKQQTENNLLWTADIQSV